MTEAIVIEALVRIAQVLAGVAILWVFGSTFRNTLSIRTLTKDSDTNKEEHAEIQKHCDLRQQEKCAEKLTEVAKAEALAVKVAIQSERVQDQADRENAALTGIIDRLSHIEGMLNGNK